MGKISTRVRLRQHMAKAGEKQPVDAKLLSRAATLGITPEDIEDVRKLLSDMQQPKSKEPTNG